MKKEEIITELKKLVKFIGDDYVDEFAANQINGHVSNKLNDMIEELEADHE